MATATPKPRNKRLSGNDRDVILRFAKKQIAETADTAKLGTAYEKLADAVHAAVIVKWPQKDMKVLARYDAARLDACIYVSSGGGDYKKFTYRNEDKRITLRPNVGGCHRIPLLLEGDAIGALSDFTRIEKLFQSQKNARIADFKALICSAATFNALAEAWPSVETLREAIVGTGTALAVFSTEVMDRLKTDAAFQAEPA